MKEIEVKVLLKDEAEYHRLIELFQSKGLACEHNTQQDSVFQLAEREVLRIRQTNVGDFLTYKHRLFNKQNAFLYADEQESVIRPENRAKIADILQNKAGLKVDVSDKDCLNGAALLKAVCQQTERAPDIVLHKKRLEFYEDNITFVLDDIQELGYFFELEKLVADEDTQDELTIRTQIIDSLSDYGLNKAHVIAKGYGDLIREKQLTES